MKTLNDLNENERKRIIKNAIATLTTHDLKGDVEYKKLYSKYENALSIERVKNECNRALSNVGTKNAKNIDNKFASLLK